MRRCYLWQRGPLPASGARAPRVLPPRWEDLGLQRGSSTPVPDQVVSSPSWSRWPLLGGRQWCQWRRTGSCTEEKIEIEKISIFEQVLIFATTKKNMIILVHNIRNQNL
jgi:hypothetical protein